MHPSSPAVQTYDAINLRMSHRTIFGATVIPSLVSIFLGLNFMVGPAPTFNPYNIPYAITGSIFLVLGLAKIAFITIHRSRRLLRLAMSAQVGWMVFWAVGTTITVFQGGDRNSPYAIRSPQKRS